MTDDNRRAFLEAYEALGEGGLTVSETVELAGLRRAADEPISYPQFSADASTRAAIIAHLQKLFSAHDQRLHSSAWQRDYP